MPIDGAIEEHQREQHVIGLRLDRPRTADLHQLAEERPGTVSRGATDIELFDDVLWFTRRTTDRAVSDNVAIDAAQVRIGEPALMPGVMNDLAAHLTTILFT